MTDVGYPNDPAEVRLIPGAAEAIRDLAEAGYVPVLVSNQSGLARGRITLEQAKAVHERFIELFAQASGVRLSAFYCPHGPDDGCHCRKPAIGLLEQAAEAMAMTGQPAVMIGDKASDVEAGRRFGACTIRYGSPLDDADFASDDWTAIRDYLLQRRSRHVGD